MAGADRRWQVKIQPPAVGGPYIVKITGRETVELHNVMVGDVWILGGQSNMGLPLRFSRNGAEEAKTANYPADCLVDDCLIHLTGRVEKQTAGVEIGLAQDIAVRGLVMVRDLVNVAPPPSPDRCTRRQSASSCTDPRPPNQRT